MIPKSSSTDKESEVAFKRVEDIAKDKFQISGKQRNNVHCTLAGSFLLLSYTVSCAKLNKRFTKFRDRKVLILPDGRNLCGITVPVAT